MRRTALIEHVAMRYCVLRCRVADHATADALAEALVAIGEPSVACADDPAGGVEVTWYGSGARRPARVEALLTAQALDGVAAEVVDESALLPADDEVCTLTAEVSVVTDPDAAARVGGEVLVVPPGPAFGDGRHPSTRLLAGLLRADDVVGARVLDLGCGSGVLGALAAHWGARTVVCADYDPDAVRCAEATGAANNLVGRQADGRAAWDCRCGDLLDVVAEDERFTVVLANLYYDLVVRLLADPRLRRCAAPGLILFSGISYRHAAEVEAAMVAADIHIETRSAEGWWQAYRCYQG